MSFQKIKKFKFHERPSNERGVAPFGQTDRQT